MSRGGWLFIVLVFFLAGCGRKPGEPVLRIGCKNFPEQLVLGEIMAQRMEKEGIRVERRFGLGSTPLIHGALAAGEIDLYVEYSGTAEEVILQLPPERDPLKSARRLKQEYRARFGAQWMEPLGFDNSYVLVVPSGGVLAKCVGISDIVPLAVQLRAALNAEFIERPDGYPALKRAYGLAFREVVNLDAGLIYRALDSGKADAGVAFGTDGRLADSQYHVLADDRNCFPRYDAVPVLRTDAAARFPRVAGILQSMAGSLNKETMRQLNAEVELEKKSPAAVAAGYWRRGGERSRAACRGKRILALRRGGRESPI